MIGIFLGLRDIFNNGGRKFVLKKICEKNYTFIKVDLFWQTDESNTDRSNENGTLTNKHY